MRWLIDYIRSCFCKHEWELIFYTAIYDRFGSKEKAERLIDNIEEEK